jgi:rSAM/selenodomain-associated transferase 1
MSNALILFVRKPEKGKVKTRIAATEGDDFALAIYKKLLAHTHSITAPLDCSKYVFYAGTIEDQDMWTEGYEKVLQAETDLGNRMKTAFARLFEKGHSRICIIGSDCYELSTEFIEDAYEQLENVDVVIGPAQDGGYYLLGMKEELKDVFQGIDWSTEKVLTQTITQLEKGEYTFALLPLLHDVDTIDEVPSIWKKEWRPPD